MDQQPTVISIPNESLFSMADGRNFMVSLPVETGESGEIINLPFLFTTDSTTGNVTLEAADTGGTTLVGGENSNQNLIFKNLDSSKNSFFLDASQLALLGGSGEHIVFTTTTGDEGGEVIETSQQQQVQQLLFTTGQETEPSDVEGTHTTYITNVMIPEETTQPRIESHKHDSTLISSRKPGRPRKIQDDIHPPINRGPFRCDVCYREFLSWPQFRKHKSEHKEDKPFRCSHCSVSFNLESNLIVHRSMHGKGPPWICLTCNRHFMRLASLKAHTMVHEKEENLFCEQCGEECITQSQLTRHMNEEHKTQDLVTVHPCRYCGQNFQSKAQLRSHMLEHAKRMASMKVSQHRKAVSSRKFSQANTCRVCQRGFSKPSQLKRHLRIHSGEKPFKCEECGYCFTQKGSLQIHMLKHRGTKPYRCDFCPSTFTQRGNLRSHISRVHIIARPGQQMYECTQCACVFRKVGSLNAHVSRMHSNTTQRVKSIDEVLENQILRRDGEPCLDPADILQQAINKSGLQHQPANKDEDQISEVQLADSQIDGTTKHYLVRMRKNNNIRWHQCVYCSKEFKKPSDLIRHMRTHTNEKPFQCEVCQRSFAVKSTLTAHMHTHTQQRAYICNVCNKRYSSASSLGVHARLHQGLKPFSCDDCGRRFRTAGNRSAHQCVAVRRERMQRRRQLLDDRRDIREQIRDSSTFLQDPLVMTENGMLVISKKKGASTTQIEEGQGNRPFICAECGCRFKKSSHLKQHEMSHKGIKPFICEICKKGFGSIGVLRAHLQTHQNIRPFKCAECGQLYTTKGSLKRHLASHSSNKPYICPYCHRDFKASANCRKHIKIHAKEVLSGIMEPESITDVMKHIEPMLNKSQQETEAEQHLEDLQASASIQHETQINSAAGTITTTVTIPDNLGPFTQESIRKLEENINQQILASAANSSVADLISQAPSQTSGLGDLVSQPASHNSQLAISFPEQGILTLGTQTDLAKSGVEFPSLSEQNTNTGLVTVCGSVEGVYIQGFDGHALDTTLFSGGIPIQTDPIEMGALSNILASSTQTEPTTEDESRFSCETCKQVFASVESLREHTTEEHSHVCTVCKQKYDSDALLQHHMASHAKQKVNKKKSECKICKHKFEDSREALEHKRRNHQKRRVPEILPSPNQSLTVNSEPEVAPVKQTVRRRNSKAVLVSPEELSKALMNENQASTLSERVFLASVQEKERLSELPKAPVIAEEPQHANVCTVCPKSFKKPSDLVRHFRTHTGDRPYVCSQCNKAFTVKSTLVAHFQTHRKEEDTGIPCHLCGSHFATKGSLRVHMRIHTGVKPLKCPHCPQSFRTSGHRKAHIHTAHRDQPSSITQITHIENSKKNDREPETQIIESEIDTDNEGITRIEVTESENTNENLQLLPIQLETTELIQLDENLLQQLQAGNFILHSADNEGTIRFEVFSDVTGQQMIGEISSDGTVNNIEKSNLSTKQCPTCGKTFVKPSQLLRHIRIHTGDKPFPCLLCPKRFNQKNALNTHLLMHSGHKPHRCEHCGKFFSQAGNLRTHIRRTHLGIMSSIAEEDGKE